MQCKCDNYLYAAEQEHAKENKMKNKLEDSQHPSHFCEALRTDSLRLIFGIETIPWLYN